MSAFHGRDLLPQLTTEQRVMVAGDAPCRSATSKIILVASEIKYIIGI